METKKKLFISKLLSRCVKTGFFLSFVCVIDTFVAIPFYLFDMFISTVNGFWISVDTKREKNLKKSEEKNQNIFDGNIVYLRSSNDDLMRSKWLKQIDEH